MRYKVDTILEISSYLERLSKEDKCSLMEFIYDGRKCKKSDEIFSDLASVPVDLVQDNPNRLLHSPDTNKAFTQFKKKLNEFRLTEISINHLKEIDIHLYKKTNVAKKILVARIMLDQGLFINSIELLKSQLIICVRFEFISERYEIMGLLMRINQLIGRNKEYVKWKAMSFEVKWNQEIFVKVTSIFNRIVHNIFCCDHHKTLIDRNELFPFIFAYKTTGLLKIKWIKLYIRAQYHRKYGNYRKAQEIAWYLLEMYKSNTVIFSRQYYLTLMQFILENMYYLKKRHVLRRASKHIAILRPIALYKKIPLIYLFLYEQFRIGASNTIINKITNLRIDPSINSFIQIKQHLSVFEIHAQFIDGKFKYCLSQINMEPDILSINCCHLQADIKSLEIICLLELRKSVLVHDKLEAFRKFIFRNNENEEMQMYKTLYQIYKALSKSLPIFELSNEIRILKLKYNPIYSFQPFCTLNWLKAQSISS